TIFNQAPVNLDLEISRRDYEDMIRDLVQKTVDKVFEALREARLRMEQIGHVILVGGATRTPLVLETLSGMFERPIDHSLDPDLCVALGASVQRGLIAGEPLGHILLDVTAHSLGVKTADAFDEESGDADYFSVIIRRNTKIPVRKAEGYFTMVDRQEGVDVEVYQGESVSCKENTQVGRFYFPLTPAPAHSPVTTEFAYDREGIVHITIDQKGYHHRKEVTLDVRKKEIVDLESSEEEQKVLNYIIEKSRRMLREDRLPPDVKEELGRLTDQYEEAIRKGEQDRVIDRLEEELLNKLEEAEEGLGSFE
ncbi:MAG: hypothetical protein EHM36_07190, partial [Deltaproteobacteria bacterium]